MELFRRAGFNSAHNFGVSTSLEVKIGIKKIFYCFWQKKSKSDPCRMTVGPKYNFRKYVGGPPGHGSDFDFFAKNSQIIFLMPIFTTRGVLTPKLWAPLNP